MAGQRRGGGHLVRPPRRPRCRAPSRPGGRTTGAGSAAARRSSPASVLVGLPPQLTSRSVSGRNQARKSRCRRAPARRARRWRVGRGRRRPGRRSAPRRCGVPAARSARPAARPGRPAGSRRAGAAGRRAGRRRRRRAPGRAGHVGLGERGQRRAACGRPPRPAAPGAARPRRPGPLALVDLGVEQQRGGAAEELRGDAVGGRRPVRAGVVVAGDEAPQPAAVDERDRHRRDDAHVGEVLEVHRRDAAQHRRRRGPAGGRSSGLRSGTSGTGV